MNCQTKEFSTMTEARDIDAERRMLDRARPSKTRIWPNNGMYFHTGLHKDLSWRAVVCATESQARIVFGPDVEQIIGAYAYFEPEDKLVWEHPGVEFVSVDFQWVRRDDLKGKI